jgi:hypothetical protein
MDKLQDAVVDDDVVDNFHAMNTEFEGTLRDLKSKGVVLEMFRKEYEKLHRTLKKSRESEERLAKRTRELGVEINEAREKGKNQKQEVFVTSLIFFLCLPFAGGRNSSCKAQAPGRNR